MSIDTLQTTDIPAGTWIIDPSHSEIGFTARHLMSKVRGRFEKFEGQIVTGDAPVGHRVHRPELDQHPRRRTATRTCAPATSSTWRTTAR